MGGGTSLKHIQCSDNRGACRYVYGVQGYTVQCIKKLTIAENCKPLLSFIPAFTRLLFTADCLYVKRKPIALYR